MKQKIILQILSIISLICCSCNYRTEKRVAGQASLVCLRDKDTLYVKLINHFNKVIYIPKEYVTVYSLNDDTIHLETDDRLNKYGTDHFFRYRNVFSFEFLTSEPIKDISPDSILTKDDPVYAYNQFLVQKIQALLPDSSLTLKLILTTPSYKRQIKAVYYDIPFLNKKDTIDGNYTFKDFLDYDSANAKYIDVRLLDRAFYQRQ